MNFYKFITIIVISFLVLSSILVFSPTKEVKANPDTETLRPNGAGDETNIPSRSGAATNWGCVSEEVSDSDTTFVVSAQYVTWYRDFYTISPLSISSGTINGVTVYAVAKGTATPNWASLKIGINTAGDTATDSAAITVTNAYATYSNAWATNPETGEAWTIEDVNALQIGVSVRRAKSDTTMYYTRVTQVYIEVDYTPIAPTGYEMSSDNYRIQADSINIGGHPETSTSYRMTESIGEFVAGLSTSTLYKLYAGYQPMVYSYISISLSSTSVTLLPNIGGVTGGTATNTITITVITDNLGGYSLYVNSSTSPSLKSGSESFADYTPSGSDPDFTWSIVSTSSEFGFTPEGSNIVQKFKDDGDSDCAISTNDTSNKCWYNFSTSNEIISQSYSSNHPSGIETNVTFKAEAGADRLQPPGTYQATITTTAIAN